MVSYAYPKGLMNFSTTACSVSGNFSGRLRSWATRPASRTSDLHVSSSYALVVNVRGTCTAPSAETDLGTPAGSSCAKPRIAREKASRLNNCLLPQVGRLLL